MGVFRRRRRLALSFATLALFVLLSSASALKLSGGAAVERRRLGGPGSSPPSCRSKCGRCAPCTAVHVPIQPGMSVPMEYYPEAWRCKCGNKLFMP
ncbi:EPIDERMAL PATTERNING FACTOR-like protein 4 [Salvia miltiorrhiza]|uniref:EPIDERMAL PATTERNING FACTOR-like protein 4 n=1 Tax=Salvia miltiorrhiza TaxID=226208 RepID=UPI0025AD2F31|nr:EPIDERMAL PATTERNING FACTOR-like protein 4 [Salvia miltiorrhiza]